MIIPDNETRIFKYGILPNKLKYTIIQDVNTDESNIVVNVKAGYLYDPKEYMGLAHFLEHMLFLGSKKYPDENYFSKKIAEFGGSSNAYTDTFETVYFLTVMSENLENIMDIFSRFFIDPLFNINAVEREINAINSEHLKNINDKHWIERQIILNSIKNNHISNRFSTGNHDTFGKDYNKIRNAMINFYNSYYCANNISIVITSNKSISFVEKLIHKYFNELKEKSITFPKIHEKLFSNTLNEYQIKTKKHDNYIIYYWDIKMFTYYLDNNIINLIMSVINLNCKCNLNNYLIELNYSSGIEVSYTSIGIFIVKVYIHSKTDIIKVNHIIQDYFNNLHNFDWDNIQKWLTKSYNITFHNGLKIANIDLATNISNNMHYFDETKIYSGSLLEFKNADKIKLMETIKLLRFKYVNIIYGTSTPLDSSKIKIDKYYGTKFYKLNKSFIKKNKLKQVLFKFSLNINKKSFELLNIKPKHINNLDTDTKLGLNVPVQLTKRFWYGGVSKFKESFVFGRIFIDHRPFYNTIKNYLITILSLNIINYYIHIIFCLEIMLGYTISINFLDSSFNIIISGHNDNYVDFFNNTLKKLREIKPEKSIIKMHIKQLKKDLINIETTTPWNYSYMILSEMIFKNTYNYKDKLDTLQSLIKNDNIELLIMNRIDQIINFKNIPVVTIIYGCIKSDNLHNCMTYNLNKNIKINKLDKNNLVHNKIVRHTDKNKCITVIFNCGSGFHPLLLAKIILLKNILEEPVFNELRTKQQLGYLVTTKYMFNDVNYIYIKVQSHYSEDTIISAINNFIKWFDTYLINLNNFDNIKSSLYNSLNQKETSISELVSKYINEIYNQKYIFNRNKLVINELKNIKLNDIIKLYHSIIKKKSIIQII